MRTMNAALLVSLLSCGIEPPLEEATTELENETRQDDLTYLNAGTFWAASPPLNPITIPVCWTTVGFEPEKQVAIEAIRSTWGRVANLNFTFRVCGADEPPSIRVAVFQATDPGGGGSSGVGKAQTYLQYGDSMRWHFNSLASGYSIDRLRYIATHEFGHALNFVHEQDSPSSKCGGTPWAATQISWWDTHSLMLSGSFGCAANRYGNSRGYLSPLDRSGARSKYGTRKIRARGDFAGQGAASVGVWRPSTGVWYINDGVTPPVTWGVTGDIPVAGDYDGNGKVDAAVWRPSSGTWYVNDNVTLPVVWGQPGDIPVPCDYNGDGKMDRAIYRPSTFTWYVNDGQTPPKMWGASGDYVVPADYTGDGKCEIAVYRPSTGRWYINAANGKFDVTLSAGGIPVPGDYGGEGIVRPAVWIPSSGYWHFSVTPVTQKSPFYLGSSGDIPVPANYNGDGIDIPAIFHPQSGNTFFSRMGGATTFWGVPGDVPTTQGTRMTPVP